MRYILLALVIVGCKKNPESSNNRFATNTEVKTLSGSRKPVASGFSKMPREFLNFSKNDDPNTTPAPLETPPAAQTSSVPSVTPLASMSPLPSPSPTPASSPTGGVIVTGQAITGDQSVYLQLFCKDPGPTYTSSKMFAKLSCTDISGVVKTETTFLEINNCQAIGFNIFHLVEGDSCTVSGELYKYPTLFLTHQGQTRKFVITNNQADGPIELILNPVRSGGINGTVTIQNPTPSSTSMPLPDATPLVLPVIPIANPTSVPTPVPTPMPIIAVPQPVTPTVQPPAATIIPATVPVVVPVDPIVTACNEYNQRAKDTWIEASNNSTGWILSTNYDELKNAGFLQASKNKFRAIHGPSDNIGSLVLRSVIRASFLHVGVSWVFDYTEMPESAQWIPHYDEKLTTSTYPCPGTQRLVKWRNDEWGGRVFLFEGEAPPADGFHYHQQQDLGFVYPL